MHREVLWLTRCFAVATFIEDWRGHKLALANGRLADGLA